MTYPEFMMNMLNIAKSKEFEPILEQLSLDPLAYTHNLTQYFNVLAIDVFISTEVGAMVFSEWATQNQLFLNKYVTDNIGEEEFKPEHIFDDQKLLDLFKAHIAILHRTESIQAPQADSIEDKIRDLGNNFVS